LHPLKIHAFSRRTPGLTPSLVGYEHLWMLEAALEEPSKDRSLVQQAAAG
jgi:hypothetical protein